jgi:CelD/BcsL family acetyltransferase involved in cellulose biosynthesis
VHVRPGNFARPVGAPFSDYSALITAPKPDLTAGEVLCAANLHTYQAIGLRDPYGVFGETVGAELDTAYAIDLTPQASGNNAFKKLLKNIRRQARQLEERHGQLHFLVGDQDQNRFDAMIELKRRQTMNSGLHDFLAPSWVREMMSALRASSQSGLHGFMVTLMAGDKPVLYHFGVRLGDHAHPWISSYDPAFSAYSPGQIFLNDCPEPLKAAGVSFYDLSTGDQKYKAIFSNYQHQVSHVRVHSDAPQGRVRSEVQRIGLGARVALGARAGDAFHRLNRRLDHIAALELDSASRVKGVFHAFSNASRRLGVNQN